MTKPRRTNASEKTSGTVESAPRIVGGKWSNARLQYGVEMRTRAGEVRTRPMKERVREAVFNLLAQRVEGALAVDLFAGTGALGFEALSRGAAFAILLEQHFPTASLLEHNANLLGANDQAYIEANDTFFWCRTQAAAHVAPYGSTPWCVFCSPPYELFRAELSSMQALLEWWIGRLPPGSAIVVESDVDFDLEPWIESLAGRVQPLPTTWDHRDYPPARVAIGYVAHAKAAD